MTTAKFATPPMFGNTAQTPPPVATAPAAAPAAEEKSTERKKWSKPVTIEMRNFIVANIKTMSYKEIADALNIEKNQVNMVLNELRVIARSSAIADAYPNAAYNQKKNKEGNLAVDKKGNPLWDYSQPLTNAAKEVEDKITELLARPEDARVGISKGDGASKQASIAQATSLFGKIIEKHGK